MFTLALLVCATTGFELANANPLPDIDAKITVVNPQNATYYTNTITVSVIVESNWGTYGSFYSLDGQNMVPIKNMTVVSREVVNPASNLPVERRVLWGNCTLSGLQNGWHNVTFFLITDHDFSLAKQYKKGDILYSETFQFKVDNSRIISIIGFNAFIVTGGLCLLAYVKKHELKTGGITK